MYSSYKMHSDDVFSLLPKLTSDGGTSKEEDYDIDATWYNGYVDEVAEDLDQNKLHELVLDYLICNGHKESAELLCTDSEMKFPNKVKSPNVCTLEQRDNIRNSIIAGNIEGAIIQIIKLVPKLLTENHRLHFKLLRQQLVELIRNKKTEKVLSFAQEHLMDKYDQPPELFSKLEQTYALLAFDQPETSPFGYLLLDNQRTMLAGEVNSAILSNISRTPISKLEHLYRMMVWNQHQCKTKGDGRPLTSETASSIAKSIFGSDQDPSSELL